MTKIEEVTEDQEEQKDVKEQKDEVKEQKNEVKVVSNQDENQAVVSDDLRKKLFDLDKSMRIQKAELEKKKQSHEYSSITIF